VCVCVCVCVRVLVLLTAGFDPNAGGVAYLNSFGKPLANPSFCFPAGLGYNPKCVSDLTTALQALG